MSYQQQAQNTGQSGLPGGDRGQGMGQPGHQGIGTKIKNAITPGQQPGEKPHGQHGGMMGGQQTGGMMGGQGQQMPGQQMPGQQMQGQQMGSNPMTTGGGMGQQGMTTGGGMPGRTGNMTSGPQTGMTTGGGMGGGMRTPQEEYEKKTHSTHDHDESESHETSTKRL
jgi:hypothetical protein